MTTPMMVFQAPRTVKFQDWKLALVYYIGLIAVAIYTLFNVFKSQNFLSVAIPTNAVAAYSYTKYPSNSYEGEDPSYSNTSYYGAQEDFYAIASQKPNGDAYKFCNNLQYDYQDLPDYIYVNNSCSYQEEAEITAKTGSEFFITTFVAHQGSSSFDISENFACTLESFTALGLYCDNSTYIKQKTATCICNTPQAGRFPVAVENLTLAIEHAFDSTFREGRLPKTFVRRSGSDKDWAVFDRNELVSLPVWKWLKIAGVDLDARNEVVGGTLDSTTGEVMQPFVRLTGVLLDAHFQYYNYHGNPDDRYSTTAVCILSIKPQMLWSSLGNENFPLTQGKTPDGGFFQSQIMHYRYGIKFEYQAMGEIYKFDVFELVNALATGAILLGTVGTIVGLIAYNNGTRMAKTYSEVAGATYNYQREYARFAANALIARQSFLAMDKDKSGYIDRQDLYEEMVTLFKAEDSDVKEGDTKRLSRQDVKVLCEFLMREAEFKTGDEKADNLQRVGDGRVSLEEWIEISGSDTTHYDTLIELIHTMNPTERTNLLHRFGGSLADKEAANCETSEKDPLLPGFDAYGALDLHP